MRPARSACRASYTRYHMRVICAVITGQYVPERIPSTDTPRIQAYGMSLDMDPPSALADDCLLIEGDGDTESSGMLERDSSGYTWSGSVQYESQNGQPMPDRIQARMRRDKISRAGAPCIRCGGAGAESRDAARMLRQRYGKGRVQQDRVIEHTGA